MYNADNRKQQELVDSGYLLTIFAPVIYTAPCIMFFMHRSVPLCTLQFDVDF
jgi:hypothetical protein